jgi:hypothetical protein
MGDIDDRLLDIFKRYRIPELKWVEYIDEFDKRRRPIVRKALMIECKTQKIYITGLDDVVKKNSDQCHGSWGYFLGWCGKRVDNIWDFSQLLRGLDDELFKIYYYCNKHSKFHYLNKYIIN